MATDLLWCTVYVLWIFLRMMFVDTRYAIIVNIFSYCCINYVQILNKAIVRFCVSYATKKINKTIQQ